MMVSAILAAALLTAGQTQHASVVIGVRVFDPSGTSCLNCDPGEDLESFRSIIEARSELDFNAWIRATVMPLDEHLGSRFSRLPLERLHGELNGMLISGQEIGFRLDQAILVYTNDKCHFLDCYKPRMSMRSASGGVRWRRRVPPLKSPVVPLSAGEYLLYVTNPTEPRLVVIEKQTGTIVEQYRVPADGAYFSPSNPASCFPFFRDGLVVLQGTKAGGTRPANILVLKTTIGATR